MMKRVAMLLACLAVVAGGCVKTESAGGAASTKYTCSMHPEVVQDKPGSCPKCGMNLVEKK